MQRTASQSLLTQPSIPCQTSLVPEQVLPLMLSLLAALQLLVEMLQAAHLAARAVLQETRQVPVLTATAAEVEEAAPLAAQQAVLMAVEHMLRAAAAAAVLAALALGSARCYYYCYRCSHVLEVALLGQG